MNTRTHEKMTRAVALLLLTALALVIQGCGGEPAQGGMEGEGQDEHTGEHGGEVHLSAEQQASAGIKVTKAAAGTIEEVLRLVARVTSNANARVHLNPRVPGIVHAIHKGLGDTVSKGETLVEIESAELGTSVAEYLKAHAMVLAADETLEKERFLIRGRLQALTRYHDGAIEVAQRIHDREKELKEKSISTARPYLEADKALQQARLSKDRELTTLRAERDTRILALDVALRQARIELKADRDRLKALGFKEVEIKAFLTENKKGLGRYVVVSPRDGVVMARHPSLGEYVDTDTTLFEIDDLSTVWVLASVYEKDLRSVRRGQRAMVKLDAFPDTVLAGDVAYIDFRISEETRNAPVRIELKNPKREDWAEEFPVRPGMFGIVELVISSRSASIVLPEAAIVHEGDKNFVFVQEDELTFHRKPVSLRHGAHDQVEIVAGLDPGETVVIAGTFLLKSLARSEELGEGHSH